MLEKIGHSFESWARRNLPDPFVLVLILTLLTWTLSAAMNTDGSALRQLPIFWLDGFWKLLSFSMQMVLIVVTGEALVNTTPVQKLFAALARVPRTGKAAVAWVSLIAMVLGWLHWGFGLIGAALFAREVARTFQKKSIRVDYPLLGAAAYLSMLLWHAGTTASAPLLVNTPHHFLEYKIGLVPLRQTIFLPMNIAACLVLLAIVPWIMSRMHPKSPRPASDYVDLALAKPVKKSTTGATWGERLDHAAALGRFVGGLGLLTIGLYWYQHGVDLTHNLVNFLLLALGLVITGSPVQYARNISDAMRGTSGIVLQFPFYGGIMGLMDGSHLGQRIAEVFLVFATAKTLPFFAYLASVFTKLFVPSGGGEWAIEGPVMLEAATRLGAEVGRTTMGIAYGNMVGNMFQPFWSIPLLAVLGLRARDILGYTIVIFGFAFPILGAALLLF